MKSIKFIYMGAGRAQPGEEQWHFSRRLTRRYCAAADGLKAERFADKKTAAIPSVLMAAIIINNTPLVGRHMAARPARPSRLGRGRGASDSAQGGSAGRWEPRPPSALRVAPGARGSHGAAAPPLGAGTNG